MAGLTIILTMASLVKSCTDKPINYHDEIEKTQEIEKSILNETQQANDKIETFLKTQEALIDSKTPKRQNDALDVALDVALDGAKN